MTDGGKTDVGSLRDARIDQVDVMNERTVLVGFSNGSSALVDAQELKEFALTAAKTILHKEDVPE